MSTILQAQHRTNRSHLSAVTPTLSTSSTSSSPRQPSAGTPFVVPSVNSHASVVLLRYGERRPMATVKKDSFSDIEEVARRYISCPADARLKFHTNLTGVGDGELVEIDPALWPHIHDTVTSLWIEAEGVPLSLPQPPNSDSPIRIVIVIWGYKTICIRINASASVASLKAMIQNREDIPPDQQRLRFRGTEMDDDETRLESYGVNQDSGVFLRLTHGASPPCQWP